MRLTPEQIEIVKAELVKRGALQRPCPSCGGLSAGISDCVVEVREFESSEDVCGVSPLIQLSCDQCGFVYLFSARILNDKRLESVALGDGVFLDFREKSGR